MPTNNRHQRKRVYPIRRTSKSLDLSLKTTYQLVRKVLRPNEPESPDPPPDPSTNLNSIVFDQSGEDYQYVTFGSLGTSNGTKLSISFWIKCDNSWPVLENSLSESYPPLFMGLLDYSTWGISPGVLPGSMLFVNQGEEPEFEVPALTFEPDVWYHILFVIDYSESDASDQIKCWVNGSTVSNTRTPRGTEFPNAQDDNFLGEIFAIGGWYADVDDADGFLDCRLDEVAIWVDEAITADVVDEVYSVNGAIDLAAISAPPDHWWSFDGSIHPNISPNLGSLTGVMNNMSQASISTDVPP